MDKDDARATSGNGVPRSASSSPKRYRSGELELEMTTPPSSPKSIKVHNEANLDDAAALLKFPINYLKKILSSCSTQSEIILPFRGVTNQHLEDLKVRPRLVKESSCCCLIDQYLLTAVLYTQKELACDVELKHFVSEKFGLENPRIGVFTELQIPDTSVSCGDVSFILRGFLDYGLTLIEALDAESLQYGFSDFKIRNVLAGITEAKSLADISSGRVQITAQILAAIHVTGHNTFSGMLTNGILWRAFVAKRLPDYDLNFFQSQILEVNQDENGAVVVEILKDMILGKSCPLIAVPDDRIGRQK